MNTMIKNASQYILIHPMMNVFPSLVLVPVAVGLAQSTPAFDDEFLFVIGCNVKSTGSGMIVAPHAQIGDGKIDVVVLRNTSRAEMLKVLRKVFDGSHVSLPCIGYHQVRSFSIEYEGPEPLDLDGELKGSAPLSVEMVPGAFQVFA